jgi:hypothetical protein
MIGTALAEWLDANGFVDYRPSGAGGDCFIDTTPQTPDAAVVIFHTGGTAALFGEPYDGPTVQILVRGGPDPRVSHARAQELYDALHGLAYVDLADGTRLIAATAVQSAPVALGTDDNSRHRHVINLHLDVYRPTALRPAHI